MGGKVWSVEEEKYFWEVIVPQAPAGLNAASKQAKKDAHRAWAPLSSQMEREMTKRLKPEERLRRKYTPIGCYEHYFQNYINRHYSPHAKASVLKYQMSLKAVASIPEPQATVTEAGGQTSLEPIAGLSPTSSQMTVNTVPPRYRNQNHGATLPMPEAPMPLFQVKETEEQGEDMIGISRPDNNKKSAAIVRQDAENDTADTSSQPGLGSESTTSRGIQKIQTGQRRARKVAHRRAQDSDGAAQSATSTPALHPLNGFPDTQIGHYNRPTIYGQQPGYFGYHYKMQPGFPSLPNGNAFQSNHAVRTSGLGPYSRPPQFAAHPQIGGGPLFRGAFVYNPPPFGFGVALPQHTVSYMGSYCHSGYTHNKSADFSNGAASMHGGMGGHGAFRGKW